MAAALAITIVGWVAVVFAFEPARFVVPAPPMFAAGVEVASGLARLFAALVLLLFPDERIAPRLRWVAGGLLVLGLGALTRGFLLPLLLGPPTPNGAMYASLVIWTAAGAFFVAGLMPAAPRRSSGAAGAVGAVAVALSLAASVGAEDLPALVHVGNPGFAIAQGAVVLPGLTVWHWVLSAVPLGLALVALGGAARYLSSDAMRWWLVAAMILLAGSQLHNLFWPSAYYPVLTTANLLRLGFGVVVAVGGVVELRRVAAERAALLAAEREYGARLEDLARLRADFGAMVAHELGAPVAAIRQAADLLDTGPLGPLQVRAREAIGREAEALAALVADVGRAASVERDDFAVRPRPVPVAALLADAAAFARTLPGDHPVTVEGEGEGMVRADPGRVGQVLRNLLGNAAKYSPPGTPIELRVRRTGERVAIEVADRGPGIHPDDRARIFEKFGRGRDVDGRAVPGVGLGLYLSRRIVRAHGGDLTVEPAPGGGSVFAFDLEAMQ